MKQPNNWSCLITALSIITDTSINDLIKKIGHDGSENINPNMPEPMCRKGFSMHEVIDVALEQGYAVTLIEFDPVLINDYQAYLKGMPCPKIYDQKVVAERFYKNLMAARGIITGSGMCSAHAVAWDGTFAIDPRNGKRYSLIDLPDFTLEAFWRFDKMHHLYNMQL